MDLGCFKQRSNLDHLQSLLEFAQLVGSYNEIGARRLFHQSVIHHDELMLEILSDTMVGNVCSFFVMAPLAIGVIGLAGPMLFAGFAINGEAIMADHEKSLLRSRVGREENRRWSWWSPQSTILDSPLGW